MFELVHVPLLRTCTLVYNNFIANLFLQKSSNSFFSFFFLGSVGDMSHNVKRICLHCGRTFVARNGNWAFCSVGCRRLYNNHISFRCKECRNVSCKVRNNSLVNSPPDCEYLNNPERLDTVRYAPW
jgi:hypothetical protein